MAFHDLNISIPQLLEYAQEVNAGQLPQTVSRFPTPKPQSHLYTGPGAKIKRRSAKVTSVQLQSQGEEGDEMGSEGEEEESETEEIPGYLPPLPKTQEDSGKTTDTMNLTYIVKSMHRCVKLLICWAANVV